MTFIAALQCDTLNDKRASSRDQLCNTITVIHHSKFDNSFDALQYESRKRRSCLTQICHIAKSASPKKLAKKYRHKETAFDHSLATLHASRAAES